MFEILISVGLPIALILVMTGVGLSLTINDFQRVMVQPKGFAVGFLVQMILLPVMALLMIALFGLNGDIAIGLFILSLCPGGATSNLYSYLAKGDVGLSVSLTAIVGFITPLSLPVLAAFAIQYFSEQSTNFSLPFLKTWGQLMIIGVLPVIIGMGIRHRWPTGAKACEKGVSRLSILILAVVIIAICVNLGAKLLGFVVIAGPATFVLNIVIMFVGYRLGKVFLEQDAQARTICLEAGVQNGTLALFVCGTLLQRPEMMIAPSIYSLIMFLTASIFSFWVCRNKAGSI